MAKKKENEDLTPAQAEENAISALPPELQALFEQSSQDDYEKIDPEDFILPRLTLTQAMSPTVIDQTYKAGQLVDLVTQTEFTTDTDQVLDIIPIYQFKNRWRWDDSGELLCRSEDAIVGVGTPGGDCATCPETRWENNRRPSCSIAENFIIMILNADPGSDIVCWSMRRSQYKIGKKFKNVSKAAVARGGAIYTRRYRIGVFLDGKDNKYWNYRILKHEDTNRFDKAVTDASVLKRCMDTNDMVRNMRNAGKFKLNDEIDEMVAALGDDDDLGA